LAVKTRAIRPACPVCSIAPEGGIHAARRRKLTPPGTLLYFVWIPHLRLQIPPALASSDRTPRSWWRVLTCRDSALAGPDVVIHLPMNKLERPPAKATSLLVRSTSPTSQR